MMPRIERFEVCRPLKANPRTADVPIVMVTALSDVANRLRGLEVGADDFLTKPVNDIALFRASVRCAAEADDEEWRLREEICGRFPGHDIVPPRMAACNDLDRGGGSFRYGTNGRTLRSVRHSETCATGGADARTLLDGETELIIVCLSMPSCDPAAGLAVSSERGLRSFQLLIAEDMNLIRLPKVSSIWSQRLSRRPVDRQELLARTAARSAARDCRTGCNRIISAACHWR